MPLSYAQYAGNGSTTTFSVPFPYLLKAHVKLYTGFSILSGTYTSLLVDGTDYTWTSSTQVQLSVAPANGVTLTVLRDTPDSSQLVPWQDGSNLIAEDLNIADLQNLYVVQEQQDRNDAGITQSTAATAAATAATTAANTATSTANAATSTANTALSTANTALSTANTASTNASAAVSTANTASSNASAAVTTANAASATANTASTNASNAVTTANAASAAAASATTTANTAASNASTALSTANTASSNAAAAVSTANTASTNASNAVSTANTASSNASTALSTANTASTNASNAVTTANTANTKADQAIAAVSNSINYTLVANVAAIPGSPANNTYIEIADSTGLESFTPLTGVPAGYVGDSGLTARLKYTTTGSTWQWLNYYANDSDARFLKKSGGTMTGQLKGDDSASAATPGYAFDGDPNTGMGRPGADELALITGGTARLTIDPAGAVAVAGALSQGGNAVVVTTDSRLSDTRTPTDGSVTNAKVAAGAAIDKTKISGTAITAADTGTVTNAMLAGSIDKTKVSGTAITAADTGTVTSTMIADGTIVNADLADGAVTEGKLGASAVTTNKVADGAVTTGKVADGAVTEGKLAAGAVTTAKVADGAITTAKIADGTIAAADLADGAVTTGKIADANVTSGKLASGAAVANIGYTPVNKAGDSITGTLNFTGGGGVNPMPVRQTRFGYSSVYSVLQLGSQSSGQTISLYVDPVANNSGNFGGNGNELLVPQDFSFLAPTALYTTFKAPLKFDDGRVLMPHQPCFSARGLTNLPNTNSYVNTTPSTLLFGNVYRNNGSHYNASTGRFTAPVTGNYYFAWNILVDDSAPAGAITSVALYKNSSNLSFIAYDQNPGSRYQMMSQSMVVDLVVGDYVEVVAINGYVHTGSETAFTGFLIG